MPRKKLEFILAVIDKYSGVLDKAQRAFSGFFSGARHRIESFNNAIIPTNSLLTKLFVLLGGFQLGRIAKGFLDTASSMERFRTSLSTTLGTAQAADEALEFVAEFAAKTPFQIEELVGAFAKLSAFGIDARKDLETLGNTAAAMGKPLDQAVEALTDAVTGEFERLKEFGIKASASAQEVVFRYTDASGKLRQSAAQNSPEIIRETLLAIWNERYAGGMAKFQSTWAGMWSNAQDLFSQFKLAVMAAGVFDFMKSGLALVLGKINELKAKGKLDEWARKIARGTIDAFEKIVIGAGLVADVWLGWKIIWKGMEIAFHGLMKVIFTGLDKLIGWIPGVNNIFEELALGAGIALEEAAKGADKFLREHTKVLKNARGGIALFKQLKEGMDNFSKSSDGATQSVGNSSKALEDFSQATGKSTEDTKKLAEALEKELKEKLDRLQEVFDAQRERLDKELEGINELQEFKDKVDTRLKELTLDRFEFEKLQVKERYDEEIFRLGELEAKGHDVREAMSKTEEVFALETARIEKERLDEQTEKMKQAMEKQQEALERQGQIVANLYEGIRSDISDTFVDFLGGKLAEGESLLKKFAEAIKQTFIKIVANIASINITNILLKIFAPILNALGLVVPPNLIQAAGVAAGAGGGIGGGLNVAEVGGRGFRLPGLTGLLRGFSGIFPANIFALAAPFLGSLGRGGAIAGGALGGIAAGQGLAAAAFGTPLAAASVAALPFALPLAIAGGFLGSKLFGGGPSRKQRDIMKGTEIGQRTTAFISPEIQRVFATGIPSELISPNFFPSTRGPAAGLFAGGFEDFLLRGIREGIRTLPEIKQFLGGEFMQKSAALGGRRGVIAAQTAIGGLTQEQVDKIAQMFEFTERWAEVMGDVPMGKFIEQFEKFQQIFESIAQLAPEMTEKLKGLGISEDIIKIFKDAGDTAAKLALNIEDLDSIALKQFGSSIEELSKLDTTAFAALASSLIQGAQAEQDWEKILEIFKVTNIVLDERMRIEQERLQLDERMRIEQERLQLEEKRLQWEMANLEQIKVWTEATAAIGKTDIQNMVESLGRAKDRIMELAEELDIHSIEEFVETYRLLGTASDEVKEKATELGNTYVQLKQDIERINQVFDQFQENIEETIKSISLVGLEGPSLAIAQIDAFGKSWNELVDTFNKTGDMGEKLDALQKGIPIISSILDILVGFLSQGREVLRNFQHALGAVKDSIVDVGIDVLKAVKSPQEVIKFNEELIARNLKTLQEQGGIVANSLTIISKMSADTVQFSMEAFTNLETASQKGVEALQEMIQLEVENFNIKLGLLREEQQRYEQLEETFQNVSKGLTDQAISLRRGMMSLGEVQGEIGRLTTQFSVPPQGLEGIEEWLEILSRDIPALLQREAELKKEAAQKEIDQARLLLQVVQTLAGSIDDLKRAFGIELQVPVERVETLKARFEETFAALFQAGPEALPSLVETLTTRARDLLEVGRETFKSSPIFQELIEEVLRKLEIAKSGLGKEFEKKTGIQIGAGAGGFELAGKALDELLQNRFREIDQTLADSLEKLPGLLTGIMNLVDIRIKQIDNEIDTLTKETIDKLVPIYQAIDILEKSIPPVISGLDAVIKDLKGKSVDLVNAIGELAGSIRKQIPAFVPSGAVAIGQAVPANLPGKFQVSVMKQFQEGIEFVPFTGPALVHHGEQIVSVPQKNRQIEILGEISRKLDNKDNGPGGLIIKIVTQDGKELRREVISDISRRTRNGEIIIDTRGIGKLS